MWKSFGKQQNPTSLYHLSFVDLKNQQIFIVWWGRYMSTIWIYSFMVNLRYTAEKHNFNVIFTYVREKTLSMPQFTKWLPSGSIVWHRSSVFPWKVIKDFLSLMYQPLHLTPQSWWAQISLIVFDLSILSTHFLDVFLFQFCHVPVCVFFNLKGFCWPNRCFCW